MLNFSKINNIKSNTGRFKIKYLQASIFLNIIILLIICPLFPFIQYYKNNIQYIIFNIIQYYIFQYNFYIHIVYTMLYTVMHCDFCCSKHDNDGYLKHFYNKI